MKSLKDYLPVSSSTHKKEVNKILKSNDTKVKSIITSHRREIDSILENQAKLTEEAIRLAVEKNSNNLYQEFKDQISSIKNANMSGTDLTPDPFYENLFSTYYGKDDKYKEENLPEPIKESVKYAKAKGYITVYSSPLDREQSDEIREYAQTISYVRAFENPVIGAIPDALQRFVLGRGLKYKFASREVQDVVDEFWERNGMEMYMKSLVWLLITESEYFPIYYINLDTGDVDIREIQPAEIKHIETVPGDKSTYLSYERTYYDREKGESFTSYYPDINYYDKLDKKIIKKSEFDGDKNWKGPNILVQFIKYMKNREVRGRVFLERVLRWAEFYNQWILDRAIINHEKGRVVWLVVLKGTRDDVWERYKTPPGGGTVKVCTPDKEWKPVNAQIDANDVASDGLFLLYQVAAGTGIPIHILTQRTTEAVYSSIRASDSPFSQQILDIQDSLSDGVIKPMFKVVLRAATSATSPKIEKTVTVKKYVKEYLRDIFRTQFDRYQDNALSDYKMTRTIKTLMESALSELDNSRSIKSCPKLYSKLYSTYESLVSKCNAESLRIFESDSAKLSKDLIKEAMKAFEDGVEVTIDTMDTPVDVTFPDMVKENLKDSAEILKIHRELGIVSKTTASAKAGYNPEQEKYLIKTENFGNEEEELPSPKDPMDDSKKDTTNTDKDKE